MRKLLPVFPIIVLLVALKSMATDVGGNIATNTTWTLANSPYVVTSSVTVNSGITLTVESGVTVKFNSNTELKVLGALTATDAIFTSNLASPAPGDWLGLYAGNVSNPTPTISLTGSQILYARDGIRADNGDITLSSTSILNSSEDAIYSRNIYLDLTSSVTADNLTISGTGSNHSGIYAEKTTLNVSNSSITGVGDHGIYLNGARASGETVETGISYITNTTISDADQSALSLANSAKIEIGGNTFTSNVYPIRYYSEGHLTFTLANNLTNNTYDVIYYSNSYIYHDITFAKASVPYYFSTVTIEQNATMTVAPGTQIKMSNGAHLHVEGDLIADADDANPIYFTSFNDDNVGGDSNGDSNDTSPSSYGWYGITFYSTSTSASLLDYCEIRFANSTNGGAIQTSAASPTLTNNTLLNSYFGAKFVGASSPIFTGNTIGSSSITPVAMSFEANPTFSNNSFSTVDNQYDAIGLLGGTMTADANIVKRNFTDIPNVTYVLLNHITVPNGRTLTIEDGVVIKSLSGYDFIIDGKLLVNGTTESPAVFTSVNDDNYGNPLDTRNDGTNQIPSTGNLGGFYFSETSDATSAITNALIKFAYYDGNYQSEYIYDTDIESNHHWSFYYRAAICINRISPTISNTVISDVPTAFDIRGNSQPVISNNKISNTSDAPIRVAVQSDPVFSGNTFSSVGRKGLGILPEVINYTDTLRKQNIAGFENITYILSDLIVNTAARVVLDSGIIIKVEQYKNIDVFGGLKVRGTTSDPVIITALADDNTGNSTNPTDNDTEGNGNATDPNSTEWGSIIFYAASDDAYSLIDHAILKYGGRYTAPITWRNAGASVSNTHLEFSQNYGVYMQNSSNPSISDVTIRTSRLDPIGMSYFADPTFADIIFDTNGSNGIRLIDGTLSANATIRKRDIAGISNIAYIMDNLTINSGATLTINPGVVLKQGSSSVIDVNEGAIKAQGTATEKIIFTSVKDDSRGGDTNIDGNGSSPSSGNWRGLFFHQSALQSHLNYCEVRYAGSATYSSDKVGTIISENNNLIVENSLIQLTTSNAFAAYGTSTATFRNNRLENVNSFPVHLSMFSNPTFEGNTVENVKYMAIGVREETFTQSATFPFRSFAGVDSITYMPTYHYGNGFKISSGTKITVPAGMIFKYNSYTLFDVDGELHMAGTAEKPIILTRIEDDMYGRPLDTEKNGPYNNLDPAGTNVAIFRNISSDASIIEHVLARLGSSAIMLESASPIIRNNTFERYGHGIYATGISEPSITDNIFRDLDWTPFTTSMVAYPSVTSGNVMEGTTFKAIRINDETLTQDTTLHKRSFGGIENIPFIFGNYTVGLGVKLKIQPGTILKFTNSHQTSQSPGGRLTVKGALEAIGSPNSDSTIVFTSDKDDFYGGDTNADSTRTNGTYGFGGIVFENESSDSESILEHVILRYAGYQAITLQSASPTIKNCSFRDNGHYGGTGALLIEGASNPILASNDFIDNAYYGIKNTGSFQIDATGSWWGHNSGPYEATHNSEGKGDAVEGNVLFDPWGTNNMINPTTGDVSLNGYVTSYDAALILQHVAALSTLGLKDSIAADVSGNEAISAMDASYVLQYSVGLIQHFPSEAENKRINENWASTHSDIIVSLKDAFIEEEGQLIEIPLTVDNVKDLYAFETVISLDKELELVEFRQTGWEHISPVTNFVKERNELRLTFATMDATNADAVLGVLVLKAKSRVTKPQLPITFSRVIGNETNLTASARTAYVGIASSILSADNGFSFGVYPNPASDYLEVNLPSLKDTYQINLVDLGGRTVHSREVTGVNYFTIDLKKLQLKNGLYLLKVHSSVGEFEQKIAIQK